MASILFTTAVLPLLVGLAFAAVVYLVRPGAALLSVAAAVAMLVVAYLLEGLPPLPPVSSKHKLPYVFGLLGLLTAGAVAIRGAMHPALAALAGLAALAWIAIRKLSADPFAPELVLALMPVAGMALAAAGSKERNEPPLLWPGFTIITALSGAYISVSGGYIGLAQILGALAALTGGFALVVFVRHLTGREAAPATTAAPVWVFVATLSVVLASIAAFASKLSAPAFAILCLGYLTPLVARRLVKSNAWWAPVAQGSVTLIVALTAAGVATMASG